MRLLARWLQWIWKSHCKTHCGYNGCMGLLGSVKLCCCSKRVIVEKICVLFEWSILQMGSVWQWWINCTPLISMRYSMFWKHWGVCVYLCVAFLFSAKGEKNQCNSCKKSTYSLAVSFWEWFYILSYLYKKHHAHYLHCYSYHAMIICVAHDSTAKMYMNIEYENWTGTMSLAHQICLNLAI